jgi:hypothetical protein
MITPRNESEWPPAASELSTGVRCGDNGESGSGSKSSKNTIRGNVVLASRCIPVLGAALVMLPPAMETSDSARHCAIIVDLQMAGNASFRIANVYVGGRGGTLLEKKESVASSGNRPLRTATSSSVSASAACRKGRSMMADSTGLESEVRSEARRARLETEQLEIVVGTFGEERVIGGMIVGDMDGFPEMELSQFDLVDALKDVEGATRAWSTSFFFFVMF